MNHATHFDDSGTKEPGTTILSTLIPLFNICLSRQSLMTLKIGRNLIENSAARLGDEQWDVYEQIFVAATDIGDFALADHYLQVITAQFPGLKMTFTFV